MIIPISIVIPFILDEKDTRLWVQTRLSKDEYNQMLEFPGGKIEKDELPTQAAVREVKEETGVSIEESDLMKFKNYDFKLSDKTILLMVFLYPDTDKKFPRDGYLPLEEFSQLKERVPPKNIEIITNLVEYFQ